MKSKILSNTIFIIFIAIIVSLGVFSFFQHGENSEKASKDINQLLTILVDESGGKSDEEILEKIKYISKIDNRYRYTLIKKDGVVIYDSNISPSKMDNHLTREEIAQLKSKKIGRSKRYSKSLGEEYQYMAVYINDNLMLRISVELNSPVSMVLSALTIVFIITIIATCISFLFISRLLDSSFERVEAVAKRMNVKTMDNGGLFDEDEEKYDEEKYDEEIRPLINIIRNQNQEISFHIKMLKDKIIEMNEILNNMKEGLVILDESDRIVSTNESAIKLLKIGELKGVEGRKILDVFYDERLEKMLCEEHRISIINTESDVYLKMYISNVNDSEGINRGKIVFIEDVSMTYLDEKYRREFSTNVSHELKTPLTSINGYAEMIYLGLASDEDIKSFSKIIYNQGNRLLNMIDDIIKLSKMDEDYKPYKEKTKVNLNETIDRIVDMLIPQANDKKVNIEYSFDEVIIIDGMKILIDEIMQNILSNAIKYNVVGGSINIEMARKEKMVEICVKDTGVGIDKEDLSRIFERFYKVDKARTKRDSSSTGLGLAIVKHASEMMGAKVHVDSEKNVGTKVVIDIPIE
ncbi:sensor histidine kinase [Peptostreptococcus porci]|uniref:sensor histidine kinase n=1 Tax=Peptostreptococcus porci TaxID=2652282 RepID=UPI002A74CBE8|nr:ATP-binding protein [Peptostreptococcus porci]MDY2795471.1 ATP-binding protein [Peptostreptococcus porci]